MKIDIKKIGAFLKSMDGADYIYLEHSIGMRSSIQNLIKRHKLTKKDVCDRLNVNPKKYEDFVKGNCNYSLIDMARLNAAFIDLESQKLAERVPIQTTQDGTAQLP